jgi:hypothetical protein
MKSTTLILQALAAAITATGLFASVSTYPVADIAEAIESARSSDDSMAVIVPAADSWSHTMADEDDNLPARAECRNTFEVMVTARDLRHGAAGAPDALALKDNLAHMLLWSDLGVPGLLCLPLEAEPVILERDGRRGREAWKLTFEIRRQIFPS